MMSLPVTLQQLTLFAEASPVKTSPLPVSGRAWLETAQDFGLSSIAFLTSCVQSGLSSKTSLVFYPAMPDGTLPSSFAGWSNSGMASPGGYLTLNISEWPNAAAVCSLSGILETEPPPKYSLSPRACAGILRRAERRGRALPPQLQTALTAVACAVDNPEAPPFSLPPLLAQSLAAIADSDKNPK